MMYELYEAAISLRRLSPGEAIVYMNKKRCTEVP